MADDIIIKDTARAEAGSNRLEFVMSDATVDRYGDIVDPAGWDLRNFKRNPVALFGHNSSAPIGKWKDVKVEGGQLKGHLELLEPGKSPRIDELRALIDADILRSVSVGFKPMKAEPIDADAPHRGTKFLKQELVECSLVSIPANPNALAIAKSLNLSPETRSLIFGEHAEGIVRRDGSSRGEPADRTKRQNSEGRQMTIAVKIQEAQRAAVALQDELEALLENDEATVEEQRELNAKIAKANEKIELLRESERALGARSKAVKPAAEEEDEGEPTVIKVSDRTDFTKVRAFGEGSPVFAQPAAVKPKGMDFLVRSMLCQIIGKVENRSPLEVLQERYGDDGETFVNQTKALMGIVVKAASAPATTTTSGWADKLVNTVNLDFLQTLQPLSVYAQLAARGPRFSFGRNGIVSIPSRASTPTIAGSFVAEGAAIPVRQGAFASVTITPRKMAVISVLTNEIVQFSTPAIEALIREAILEDTATALDAILMDATAASTTRPAGLRNGVSGKTASTATATIDKMIADLTALLGDLVTANSLRSPVWIMNPVDVLAASLITTSGGSFAFPSLNGENPTLLGYPVLTSTNVASARVMLVEAADFFSATSDVPQFDVSDSATLHMEDTSPTAIGTAGTPNVVAAPVRSLFQTDCIAIRMIMRVNWAMRRSGVIAFVDSTTW